MENNYIISRGSLVNPRLNVLGPVVDILVEDGMVKAVSTSPIESAGATLIDARGLSVMPGLIDAHVHIFMNEANIAALANYPQTYVAAKATKVLREMLARGFTTVRDVAGGDYGMRDAVEAGLIESPRLFIGGKAISQTGGHGDFRGRMGASDDCACCSGLVLFSTLADGVPEVIKATREQLRQGADHIKIMLSGGVASPNDPLDSIQYRVDEIQACTEEAERWGAYVCAHAYSDIAIRRAILNGVRTIEHGNFVSPETADLMASMGKFVVPTPIVHHANYVLGAASGKSAASMEKNERVRLAGIEALKIYKKSGVAMGLGSDLSMHTQHFQNEALVLMASVLPNADVIRAATTVNAAIIKMEGQLGELIPGAIADILIIRGNPYDDISVLAKPEENMLLGMRSGVLFKNRIF